MKNLHKLATAIGGIAGLYIFEDEILITAMEYGYDTEDMDDIKDLLVQEYNYKKCILNTEDGEDHVYSPLNNQACNQFEEWVYVSQSMKPLDLHTIGM